MAISTTLYLSVPTANVSSDNRTREPTARSDHFCRQSRTRWWRTHSLSFLNDKQTNKQTSKTTQNQNKNSEILDYDGFAGALFKDGTQAEIQHRRVALLQRRFVEHFQTQHFILAVGTAYFEESVDIAHSRYHIGKERLQFRLDF